MVKCYLSPGYSAGAMLRVSWLLLGTSSLVIVFSLLSGAHAATQETNKLSDVSAEEGAIDQLEAYLLQNQQQRLAHDDHQGVYGGEVYDHKNSKIEFGVGPNDPRYFGGSDLTDNFQIRSGPVAQYRDDHIRPKAEPAYDHRYMGDDDRAYVNYDYGSSQRKRQQLVDAYNKQLREKTAYGREQQQLQDVGRQRFISEDEITGKIPTSQPESVYYLHHARQDTAAEEPDNSKGSKAKPSESYNPNDPSSTRADEDKGSKTKTGDTYNPNDPSSNVNIDVPGPVVPGTEHSPVPAHYQHNQQHASASQGQVVNAPGGGGDQGQFTDVYFTALVAGITAAAVCVIIGTGVCWYKFSANQRAAKDAEYPAYGVTGPSRELSPGSGAGGSGGDRTLAHSAHMYHYQQQKNQMIAIDKSGGGEGGVGGGASDGDSEEEEDCEDRDYTVYECPGLAPMGEMVVPNPMYPPEDGTPASPTGGEGRERDED